MSRRYTYHRTAQAASPATPATQPRPERGISPLQVRLRSAVAVGVALFVAQMSVAAYIWWLQGFTSFQHYTKPIATMALVSFVSSCGLTVWWLYNLGGRADREANLERRRRWDVEDDERFWLRAQSERAQDKGNPAPASLAWLHRLAHVTLERHFGGQSITRTAMVKSKLCSQAEWNLLNRVFLAAGLKRKKTLSPGNSLTEAWACWCRQVELEDGHILTWTAFDHAEGSLKILKPDL